MVLQCSSPSSSSDHDAEDIIASTIPSPTASQFEARPRAIAKRAVSADFSDCDSDANAPSPNPVASRCFVPTEPRLPSSPDKPSVGNVKSSPLRPKRSAPSSCAENDVPKERNNKKKCNENEEVGAIEKMTPSSQDDDQTKAVLGIWTEENEIGLLNGLATYIRQKGSMNDMPALLQFIRGSLHVDVDKSLLVDELRNLREKYEENAKTRSDGKKLVFKNPHAQKIYELSRDIWTVEEETESDDEDDDNSGTSTTDSSGISEEEADASEEHDAKTESLVKLLDSLTSKRNSSGFIFGGIIRKLGIFNSDDIINKLLPSIEASKAKELAEMEDNVCSKAMELYIMLLEYHIEAGKLALEAIRASK